MHLFQLVNRINSLIHRVQQKYETEDRSALPKYLVEIKKSIKSETFYPDYYLFVVSLGNQSFRSS